MSEHRRSRRERKQRKDRLIQTRVGKDLEGTLKDEADKRRLSVSHLIRNVLEDAFDLVEGVAAEVDNLVADGLDLADHVANDMGKIAKKARESATSDAASTADSPEEPEEPQDDGLQDVLAWNAVTLNRAVRCSRCDRQLKRGQSGHMGLMAQPGQAPAWLCDDCLDSLSD